MKTNIIIALIVFGAAAQACTQNINWRAFEPGQKHIVHLQAGFDYGLTLGLGYGYKLHTRMPAVVNLEYSFPAGERLFDDFKVRLGGQVQLVQWNGLSLTAKIYSPFRRYESNMVRLINFGGEFSGVVGYYRKHWYVAGEFGFDKAIVTHVQHSDQMLENYPDAQDGWYVPTGGNYFFGLQAGVSFGRNDISLKAGGLATQGWKTAPYVPKYAVLAFSRRF